MCPINLGNTGLWEHRNDLTETFTETQLGCDSDISIKTFSDILFMSVCVYVCVSVCVCVCASNGSVLSICALCCVIVDKRHAITRAGTRCYCLLFHSDAVTLYIQTESEGGVTPPVRVHYVGTKPRLHPRHTPCSQLKCGKM